MVGELERTAAANEKAALRRAMTEQLQELDPDRRRALSAGVCERLMGLDFFDHAVTVMLYLPMNTEVDTAPLALRCFQQGKTVCAPRMDWEHRRMTPVELSTFDTPCEVRQHGVKEPAEGRPVPLEEIDVIVTPGIAFDVMLGRLGRGAGFYDRFLSQPGLRAKAKRCGICFDFQVVERLPVETHDVALDAIVTERRVIGLGAQTTLG